MSSPEHTHKPVPQSLKGEPKSDGAREAQTGAEAVIARVGRGMAAPLSPIEGLRLQRAIGNRALSTLLSGIRSRPALGTQVIQRVQLADTNPALPQYVRERIVSYIQSHNNENSVRHQFNTNIQGTPWHCELRVDLAGAQHGNTPTPHIQFTHVTRNGNNQNIDDIRQTTSLETLGLLTGSIPQSIIRWATNILTAREQEIQNPPPPPQPVEGLEGMNLFD